VVGGEGAGWGGRRGGSGGQLRGHRQDSRRDSSAAGGEGSGVAARGWRRKGRWSGGDWWRVMTWMGCDAREWYQKQSFV
jgi:hypothetical protein